MRETIIAYTNFAEITFVYALLIFGFLRRYYHHLRRVAIAIAIPYSLLIASSTALFDGLGTRLATAVIFAGCIGILIVYPSH